jgi:hypothetical protein
MVHHIFAAKGGYYELTLPLSESAWPLPPYLPAIVSGGSFVLWFATHSWRKSIDRVDDEVSTGQSAWPMHSFEIDPEYRLIGFDGYDTDNCLAGDHFPRTWRDRLDHGLLPVVASETATIPPKIRGFDATISCQLWPCLLHRSRRDQDRK